MYSRSLAATTGIAARIPDVAPSTAVSTHATCAASVTWRTTNDGATYHYQEDALLRVLWAEGLRSPGLERCRQAHRRVSRVRGARDRAHRRDGGRPTGSGPPTRATRDRWRVERMTRVRRPTSGFMSEGAVESEQKLTDQYRQKDRGLTSGSSARRGLIVPSDIGTTPSSGALLAGARKHTTSEYANAR